MKKAILDQLFLGFILLMGVVTFVATVNDETSTRNYIYDLKALVKASAQSMSKHYEQQIDMCTAQNTSTGILNQQKLGIDSIADNLVSYKWSDSDGDGQPDQVTTTIAAHPHDTFWYRFFDNDSFNVGPFSWTEPVDAYTLTIQMGNGITGNNSSIGIYQRDNNDCVIPNSMSLIFGSQWTPAVGETLATGLQSPPNYFFIIPGGGKISAWENASFGDQVTLSDTHCAGDTNNYSITIAGETQTKNIYFQDNDLNNTAASTEDPMVRIVPEVIWDVYNDIVEPSEQNNTKNTYEEFLAFCESQDMLDYIDQLNSDNDPDNDVDDFIDCFTDPNGQYQYGFEDNASTNADDDYNDVFLDAIQVTTINSANTYSVNADNSISLDCSGNTSPTVIITCPGSIDENTSTTISYTADDSDGHIPTIIVSANNGTAVDNNDGTITYTPFTDYTGTDTITIFVQDNEGAGATDSCDITVLDINGNNAPTCTQISTISLVEGETKTQNISCQDNDGDGLTYSISDNPSWVSISGSTLTISPQVGNKGTYSDIKVSVDDGTETTTLSFDIEVEEDTTEPTCDNILDQTVEENTTFNLDLNTICTDNDGDNLSFTVSTDTGMSLAISNGIINETMPSVAADTDIEVTITATDDDNNEASTTFTLTIENSAAICTIDELDNFKNDSHGWSGGSRSGDTYIIPRDTFGYKTYSFGDSCKEVDVTLKFIYKTTSGWEGINEDQIELWVNGSLLEEYDGENITIFKTTTETVTTDASGNLEIKFRPDTTANAETLTINKVRIIKN